MSADAQCPRACGQHSRYARRLRARGSRGSRPGGRDRDRAATFPEEPPPDSAAAAAEDGPWAPEAAEEQELGQKSPDEVGYCGENIAHMACINEALHSLNYYGKHIARILDQEDEGPLLPRRPWLLRGGPGGDDALSAAAAPAPQGVAQWEAIAKVPSRAEDFKVLPDAAAGKPLRPTPPPAVPSDEALQRYVGTFLPWDTSRFDRLELLQKCPRNRGEVWKVKDLHTDRLLAAKCMPMDWVRASAAQFHLANDGETEVPWMDFGVTRWLSTVGYRHSVDFQGLYSNGDYVVFVMGFAEGGDLFSYTDRLVIEPGPGYPMERALRPLVVDILSAVAELHRVGVAHRDLSLENILLAKKGGASPLKLIDFAMATTQRQQPGGVPPCGKASYVAPEVHKGEGYDAFKADSFACGVLIYALMLRDYPWRATKPGTCLRFDYASGAGLEAFLLKRRSGASFGRLPVAEVISPELAELLVGLLNFDADRRLELCRPKPEEARGGLVRTVWMERWLQET